MQKAIAQKKGNTALVFLQIVLLLVSLSAVLCSINKIIIKSDQTLVAKQVLAALSEDPSFRETQEILELREPLTLGIVKDKLTAQNTTKALNADRSFAEASKNEQNLIIRNKLAQTQLNRIENKLQEASSMPKIGLFSVDWSWTLGVVIFFFSTLSANILNRFFDSMILKISMNFKQPHKQ